MKKNKKKIEKIKNEKIQKKSEKIKNKKNQIFFSTEKRGLAKPAK